MPTLRSISTLRFLPPRRLIVPLQFHAFPQSQLLARSSRSYTSTTANMTEIKKVFTAEACPRMIPHPILPKTSIHTSSSRWTLCMTPIPYAISIRVHASIPAIPPLLTTQLTPSPDPGHHCRPNHLCLRPDPRRQERQPHRRQHRRQDGPMLREHQGHPSLGRQRHHARRQVQRLPGRHGQLWRDERRLREVLCA